MSSKEKTIELDNGKKYIFKIPSVKVAGDADYEYSKSYTRALTDGLLPRVVIEQKNKDAGAWTEEDQKKDIALNSELEEILLKSASANNKEERDKLKQRYYNLQESMSFLSAKKAALSAHSAEAKAEEGKIATLMVACCLDGDHNKIWETRDDLDNEENSSLMQTIANEFMAYISGMDEKIGMLEEIILGNIDNDIESTDEGTKESTEDDENIETDKPKKKTDKKKTDKKKTAAKKEPVEQEAE